MRNPIKQFLNSYFLYKLNLKFNSLFIVAYYKSENTITKKDFFNKIQKFKVTKNKTVTKRVLVQRFESYDYFMKFCAASKAFSSIHPSEFYLYDPEFTRRIGWIDKKKDRYHLFFKKNIDKIYTVISNKIIFTCKDIYSDQKLIQDEFNQITSRLSKVEDIINIEIDGVIVGDLIYDTYLRFYTTPTISDVNDLKLKKLIYISLDAYYSAKQQILKRKITTLFTTFSSYISSGIVIRLCLKYDVEVYAIASPFYVAQKLTKEYPFHSVNHVHFNPKFELTNEQKENALLELNNRFQGKMDSVLYYMKASSYTKGSINPEVKKRFENKKRNVVIYPHDIYDSPHDNRKLLFNDLYQFLVEILSEISKDNQTNYWFKPHPNAANDCKEVLYRLVEETQKDNIKVLPDDVTNYQVIQLCPDIVATAYGTVAMEMAFNNIKVLALFDNPYVNFNFAKTCYSKEEYYAYLNGSESFTVDFDREQILSYYYQFYKKNTEIVNQELWSKLSHVGNTYSDEYLVELTDCIANFEQIKNYYRSYFYNQ